MIPGSEALEVSKKIIEEMSQDVEAEGGEFLLVILPTIWDIYDYDWHPDFKDKWKDLVSYVCDGGINCLDLMDDFKSINPNEFDSGYDQTHYGPKTNKFIADLIYQNRLN